MSYRFYLYASPARHLALFCDDGRNDCYHAYHAAWRADDSGRHPGVFHERCNWQEWDEQIAFAEKSGYHHLGEVVLPCDDLNQIKTELDTWVTVCDAIWHDGMAVPSSPLAPMWSKAASFIANVGWTRLQVLVSPASPSRYQWGDELAR